MRLCIDAGNSRLKWGLRDGAAWLAQGALAYDTLEELPTQLSQPPAQVVACNVAGEAVARRIDSLAQRLDAPLIWLRSSASACGVTNAYERPDQLGADRWAALIGARRLAAGPLLVVMAGTATTIDTLDATGLFRGGLILPGLALMREALARNTANLPHAAGQWRAHPTNTDDAIASGAIQATLGAIARQRALTPEAACLLSGGAAEVLSPLLDLPHRRIDNLVLEGLAVLA